MRTLHSKRTIAIACLVLIALFVVRPRVAVLHNRVAQSLSAELGRPVAISSVHLRFLPRPGLELENLAIYENGSPAAEPLLRSPDVTAWLRVSSLFRHRIEISQLSLRDASLNLGRNADGKWNIQELLERTSRAATAPTGSNRKEPRREFPYVEAEHARINFKNGIEKTHFALTDAEFALWQDSENQWSTRLRARPIRTDANLTDTGTISISGSWLRSVVLANTPIRFSIEWKQAQIGQLSKLLTGTDKRWRGGVLLAGTVTGTVANPKILTDLAVDEFRSQDVLAAGDMKLRAHCAAEYNVFAKSLADLDCRAPVGTGSLEIEGSATQFPAAYSLKLLAAEVPAQSLFDFARHVSYAAPSDLRAMGALNLALSFARTVSASVPEIKGEGEIIGTRLSSASTGDELRLGTVPLRVVPAHKSAAANSVNVPLLPDSELQLGPIGVALGRPTPVQAQLLISQDGYKASVHGEATIKRLLSAAHMLHIPAPQANADGAATINLALSHAWMTPSAITGTAQLQSVHAQVLGLNSPLQIHHADLTIRPDSVRLNNLEASSADITWHGSLLIPRPCVWPDACPFQFSLHLPRVSAATLNELFNPAAGNRPWYRLLGIGGSANSFLVKTRANGPIVIDKLILGGATCTHFTGDLVLENAKVSLTNIHASVMSGRASGNLKADFSMRPPAYSGSGAFESVSLGDVAKLTGGEFADGSVSAKFTFASAGSNLHDFVTAAKLSASFSVRDGVFPNVVLTDGAEALHANSFSGELALREGEFSFSNSKLESENGVFKLSGTASLTGGLNLTMTSANANGSNYLLSGTIAETRVSPIANPPTQAALKP